MLLVLALLSSTLTFSLFPSLSQYARGLGFGRIFSVLSLGFFSVFVVGFFWGCVVFVLSLPPPPLFLGTVICKQFISVAAAVRNKPLL